MTTSDISIATLECIVMMQAYVLTCLYDTPAGHLARRSGYRHAVTL